MCVRLIDEELRQLVGGHRVLLESKLTRADLLQFLKAKGAIHKPFPCSVPLPSLGRWAGAEGRAAV